MPKPLALVFVLALVTVAQAEPPAGDEAAKKLNPTAAAVYALLERQQTHWNAGEIERFFADYWNSPELTFSSGGKTLRGFTGTRDRYLAMYPTPERMGQLGFSELEVTPLGDKAAFVVGRWQITKDEDTSQMLVLAGNFTLVLRQIEGRWVIVHDHTSSLPSETKP